MYIICCCLYGFILFLLLAASFINRSVRCGVAAWLEEECARRHSHSSTCARALVALSVHTLPLLQSSESGVGTEVGLDNRDVVVATTIASRASAANADTFCRFFCLWHATTHHTRAVATHLSVRVNAVILLLWLRQREQASFK